MNVLAVDDEHLALISLVDAIKTALPNASVHDFRKASQAIEYATTTKCEIAFLDINMSGTSGIEVAKKLKDITPDMNIIFATGYSEYALEALDTHPSGYMMKPITAEQINKELDNLRYPVEYSSNSVRVQTFGNFDIFVNNVPIEFNRSKSKEILAYLVDKRGTNVTAAELASVIWEDGVFDRSRQKQMQVYICNLKKTLQDAGAGEVIIKTSRNIMVDVTKFECDYYKFLEGDITAINSYSGQYMNAYSWAEFTVAFLDKNM